MKLYNQLMKYMVMAPADDGAGAGGGNTDPKPEPEPEPKGGDDWKAKYEALEERLNKIEGAKNPDDPDLLEKQKHAQAQKDKQNTDAKSLESAIKFSMTAKDWAKEHEGMLPKDVHGILDAADKESYDSPVEKDRAIKSGIVQSFFQVQENLDLLTASQKSTIEDWLKLTKNGKEEKAQTIYDSVFEPTFEMLKRVEKAKQLGKAGQRGASDSEEAYKKRLIELSEKHYKGVTKNA